MSKDRELLRRVSERPTSEFGDVRILPADRDRLIVLAAESVTLRESLEPPKIDREKLRTGDTVDYCFGKSIHGDKEWML